MKVLKNNYVLLKFTLISKFLYVHSYVRRLYNKKFSWIKSTLLVDIKVELKSSYLHGTQAHLKVIVYQPGQR